MRVRVLFVLVFPMFMRMPVLVSAVVTVLMFILLVRVRRAFVDAKLHALEMVSLRPLEVHVKVAEIELRQLPFERGRFHAEIDERADRHVAADA